MVGIGYLKCWFMNSLTINYRKTERLNSMTKSSLQLRRGVERVFWNCSVVGKMKAKYIYTYRMFFEKCIDFLTSNVLSGNFPTGLVTFSSYQPWCLVKILNEFRTLVVMKDSSGVFIDLA